MRRILMGIDGSVESLRAVAWVARAPCPVVILPHEQGRSQQTTA